MTKARELSELGDKITVNGSGVDVTGTVTADGLTVDKTDTATYSSIAVDDTLVITRKNNSGTNNQVVGIEFEVTQASGVTTGVAGISAVQPTNASSADLVFQTRNAGTIGERMRIDSGGDISFYEDTGTTPKFFWDASAEKLGIGTTDTTSVAQAGKLKVRNDVDYSSTEFEDNATLMLQNETNNHSAVIVFHSNSGSGSSQRSGIVGGNINSNTTALGFYGDIGNKTAATKPDVLIDSSGNLLVGTTDSSVFNNSGSGTGINLQNFGNIAVARDGNDCITLNRLNSDGAIAVFNKDGSTVGYIGTGNSGDLYIGNDDTGLMFAGGSDAIMPTNGTTLRDNAIDLGLISYRFDDVYATNGTIQTSDRNEKQDIEALSDAEQRVAVAAKGLLRKYRWKDAVAEKGDAARIHFGIIAQDLQAAFEAEGLDAGRYGMFISSTWWEADRVIPAVAAQDAVYETVVIPAEYDADGNEISPETTEQRLVSEAVEAQPERIETDFYLKQEEAPEGAVQRTRMGVRYPELLAFIIAAI